MESAIKLLDSSELASTLRLSCQIMFKFSQSKQVSKVSGGFPMAVDLTRLQTLRTLTSSEVLVLF